MKRFLLVTIFLLGATLSLSKEINSMSFIGGLL